METELTVSYQFDSLAFWLLHSQNVIRKLRFLVLLSIVVTTMGKSGEIERLPTRDLILLRDKALARVQVIDDYDEALTGLRPKRARPLLTAAFNSLVHSSDRFKQDLAALRPSANCRDRLDYNVNLINELREDYISFWTSSSNRNSLQARIEIANLLELAELQLFHNPSQKLFYYSDSQCHFTVESGLPLESDLNLLSRLQWGKRGITEAFPLSNRLLVELNSPAPNFGWVKTALEIAALTVGPEYFFSALAIDSPLLEKGALLISMTGLGAYQGYAFQNSKQPTPFFSDYASGLQFSVRNFLKADFSNKDLVYKMAKQLEDTILQYNINLRRTLQPQIDLASQRFGNPLKARHIAQEKLLEIETELHGRSTTNSHGVAQVSQ